MNYLFNGMRPFGAKPKHSPQSSLCLQTCIYHSFTILLEYTHSQSKIPEKTGRLLYQLVNAATQKDGLIILNEYNEHFDCLTNNGFPVRIAIYNEKFQLAWLVGRITICGNKWRAGDLFQTAQVPSGIADKVGKSAITESNHSSVSMPDLWNMIDSNAKFYSFFSIKDRDGKWPEEISNSNPPWAELPDKKSLMEVGKPRSLTPGLDEELRKLCSHKLYGVLIQIFFA